MPKGVYNRKTEEERFWEKVDIGEDNECWNWNASSDPDGYGYFSFTCVEGEKRTVMAHRYSLMLKLNNPDLHYSVFARHTCDNRRCVNPNHIIPGSAKENSEDMVERNRSLIGEKNHNATVSDAIALNILEEYKMAKEKGEVYGCLERLAHKYNLPKQTVYRITARKSYRHLSVS